MCFLDFIRALSRLPIRLGLVGLLFVRLSGGEAGGEARPDPKSRDWWSLRPLVRPEVPEVGGEEGHPVDAFVDAVLRRRGLERAPAASRRVLIRRLSFDLTGLPPTPEEVERFVADADPQAYERLVDRLLASPEYGERWARHWLDVVHFGETHGYDKDKPRPNAWPYRDYVIRSLNEDKRYDRFVQEQVAGDVLFPGTRDGVEALGFIAAGPWDFIGHAEVPETKIDGKVARHLDRDDMVVNTIQTFTSLTIQCAQCHHHKFDPISVEDYYGLQAVFAAVDRADQPYDVDPEVGRKRRDGRARTEELGGRLRKLEAEIQGRAADRLKDLDGRIAAAVKAGKESEAYGYHSAIEAKDSVEKWVQVDLGRPVALHRVRLHPCRDDFAGIGEGFGFPVRYRVEACMDAAFTNGVTVLHDRTGVDVANPRCVAQEAPVSGVTARHVRVTAVKLAPRSSDFILALAELEVLDQDGRNVALGAAVSSKDSIEAPVRWQQRNLTDGWAPGPGLVGRITAVDVEALRRERAALIASLTTESERLEIDRLRAALTAAEAALKALPPVSTAYIASVYKGSGAFVGTGGQGGKPRPIFVLSRGNVQKPGAPAVPGALSCVEGLPSRFELPPDHAEGERRASLARWLTRRENPLVWRSIVNRVWQYHFGRGLVETPNDFGRMGALPTHPELLDWLAMEFRDGGQSMKALHRLLVTSATYRQRSDVVAGRATELDADNRFLWRQNRRKLEAEAVRDAVLMVSGKLDRRMGGPSFQDFVIEKPEHSPHYEYHLHDPEDPRTHRRSVYRFIVRSQQQPFMTVLDCADPSMQVGRRNEGVSPLQALAMLNNPFMLTQARHQAARLRKAEPDLGRQVARAHYEAIGRPADADELQELTAYARVHGLENTCRAILNLNEFAYVD